MVPIKHEMPRSLSHDGVENDRRTGRTVAHTLSNMIEEISEVNSRKGGNPTPGGSQKPRVAGPGGGRKGGRSCTEARVTNLPHASGRTKDGRAC